MNVRLMFCISSFCFFTACLPKKKKLRHDAVSKKAEKIISLREQASSEKSLLNSSKTLPDTPNVVEIQGIPHDWIVCRVNGANILYSELQKARIDKNGQPYSLDELIAEELLWQKAAELKCIPAMTEVEQRIIAIKQAHGLLDASETEFREWLRYEAHMTPAELQRQLLRLGAANQVKIWNAQESAVVSEKEKEEYYASHTFKTDALYNLKVLFKDTDAFDELATIDPTSDEWVDIGWVKESEIAPAMASITSLAEGQVSIPFRTEHGYQIVQCIAKRAEHIKTYDECALEIEKKLIHKKQKKADKKLVKKLKERASIVMLKK